MAQVEPPVILLSGPMLSPLTPLLEAHGWRVALADDLTDADRAQVRAIAHAGPLNLSREFMTGLPRLGLLACVTAGYDGVDVGWCRANGIEVTHAQGANADDVADFALGLLLAAWRDIVTGDRRVREGRWTFEDRSATMRPGLKGRKAGVVGLGHIGSAIARRLEAFGMEVAWWGPNPKSVPWPRANSLVALAEASDILIVAALTDETSRGMIDKAVIEALGPQGLIVNIGRGALVDEDALIEALKDGRLGLAALDVFAQEPTPAERWADVPNVVLAPHSAGATSDTFAKLTGQAVENIRRHIAGELLMSPVRR